MTRAALDTDNGTTVSASPLTTEAAWFLKEHYKGRGVGLGELSPATEADLASHGVRVLETRDSMGARKLAVAPGDSFAARRLFESLPESQRFGCSLSP